MALVMMLGFKASCWPLATTGSTGRNVPSVAARPGRPTAKLMAGVQDPNCEAEAFAARGMEAADVVAAARSAKKRVLVCILEVGWFDSVFWLV